MVWLHLNCQKDHPCHQHCLPRKSLVHERKYLMIAEYRQPPVMQLKEITTVNPKAFPTLTIGSTGTVTWTMQMSAKTTVRQTTYQM
jgi:hypothetical protein